MRSCRARMGLYGVCGAAIVRIAALRALARSSGGQTPHALDRRATGQREGLFAMRRVCLRLSRRRVIGCRALVLCHAYHGIQGCHGDDVSACEPWTRSRPWLALKTSIACHQAPCKKPSMAIVAIANQKGGVGKTTSTVALGAALAERGHRVLLLDADPQGGLSDALGINTSGGELFGALYRREDISGLAQGTRFGFEVIANGPLFEGFTPAASTQDDRESFLRESFSKLPATRWDFVLIDCPPRLDLISTNALTAADAVLVPIILEAPSVTPFGMLLQQVAVVRKKWNPTLSVSGVVACKVDLRDKQTREILAWLRTTRDDVYETVIHKNVRLSESHNTRAPITAYASDSQGARDYRALAAEFESRHGVAFRSAANA